MAGWGILSFEAGAIKRTSLALIALMQYLLLALGRNPGLRVEPRTTLLIVGSENLATLLPS